MNQNTNVAPIRNHPGYLVTSDGRVLNEYKDQEVSQSGSSKGPKVNLRALGDEYTTRLVSVLVAEAFVPVTDPRFNVVVHLDNDPWNVCSSNLVWRTRSYARRYRMQFKDDYPEEVLNRPVEDEYGLYYENILEAALNHGLCYVDIWRCLEESRPVPLTGISFYWAE